VISLLGENASSILGLNLNLGFFLPQEILFAHGKKFMGLKKTDLNLSQGSITSPSRLLTILPRRSLITFAPKETIDKKKKEREGESEEGEKVIWCEESGKYGGVFIGGNCSTGYKHH